MKEKMIIKKLRTRQKNCILPQKQASSNAIKKEYYHLSDDRELPCDKHFDNRVAGGCGAWSRSPS